MSLPDSSDHTELTISGLTLRLLADRGVYWPAHETLFIADTHFGKSATFRRGGIPVPRGGTDATLSTVSKMIDQTVASHLVILGDMFHTRSSLSRDVRTSLETFFARHAGLLITLVQGNHDTHVGTLPETWPVDTIAPGKNIDGVVLTHHPSELPDDAILMLCGHLHPSISLGSKTESLSRLPCFYLSKRCLVLPAIGKFTGTHLVRPQGNDRVWVIAEDQIVERPGACRT